MLGTNYVKSIDELCERMLAFDPKADTALVRRAYTYAKEAHEGQRRASGEPYIVHPLCTASTLVDMRLPANIVAAGLLHDVPEDTPRTLDDVRAEFGDDIASMVEGITKLGKIKYRGIDRYIENLRKMFLAMAADVRVVFIKFADRLHNLQTLDSIPPKKQQRIALESLEIYSPIANRLGMGEMKGALEDAAFRYIQPKDYEWVKGIAKVARNDKEAYIERVMHEATTLLKDAGMQHFEIQGRAKHLYSLYKKLLKHDRNMTRVYDILAVRVITNSVADCYATLGIIHGRWTPLKGRIKDYIAQPKPNGYRSLHTTVFCEDGEIVEFQIRTREMHAENEFGIAAHWSYDEEKGKYLAKPAQIPDWVHDLATIQEDLSDAQTSQQSLEEMKIDIFRDRIFVFTPNGDVIDLPEQSTCIDFAYAVHTDIGNTCTAAKVNEEAVPLTTTLKNGDMVEIFADKSRKGPNPDWIHHVKTRHAKAEIRQFARSRISSWIKGIFPGDR